MRKPLPWESTKSEPMKGHFQYTDVTISHAASQLLEIQACTTTHKYDQLFQSACGNRNDQEISKSGKLNTTKRGDFGSFWFLLKQGILKLHGVYSSRH